MFLRGLKQCLKKLLKGIAVRCSPAYRTTLRNEQRLISMEYKLNCYAHQNQMMFWWSRIAPGRSLRETQMEFYRMLPKAEGPVRIFQMGGNFLLQQFKKICEANGLQYWLIGGTLLGAVRTHGFIPWDDDVDLGMLREDSDRLEEILRDSDTFVYERWLNQISNCTCMKFRLKDSESPFFIDILLSDYAGDEQLGVDELSRRIEAVRRQERAAIQSSGIRLNKKYVEEPPEGADKQIIDGIIQECISRLPAVKEKRYIYRAIEVVTDHFYSRLMPVEMLFPLRQAEFEGEFYPIPSQTEDYLYKQFGNYYMIPADCVNRHEAMYKEKISNGIEILRQYGIDLEGEA